MPSVKEEKQKSNEPSIIYQNEKMKEMENLAKMIIKDGTSKQFHLVNTPQESPPDSDEEDPTPSFGPPHFEF